tara:strand:- start:299 stop:577 length:279 start_codon:yes stop_codon:yes gene_type:complete
MLFFKNQERLSNRDVFSIGFLATVLTSVIYFLYECVMHSLVLGGDSHLLNLSTWSYPLRREVAMTILVVLFVGISLSVITSFYRAINEKTRQ